MFLTGILVLRSDIYWSTGDGRSLQDIIGRPEEDWKPRVGMKEEQLITKNDGFLEAAANRFSFGPSFTTAGLRSHLEYVLKEIERISDQPTFSSPGPGGVKLENFDWKTTLLLICHSLAIAPFGPKIEDSFWEVSETEGAYILVYGR
jgi:hypothetical protein